MIKRNLSVDIGGTKILICVLDQNCKILFRKKLATSRFLKNDKYDLERLTRHLVSFLPRKNFNRVGISLKGNVINNRIRYSSLLGGKVNIDPQRIFKRYLQFESLVADNDVFSMAKAEIMFGIGKRIKNFSLINLGTGLRIANVVNGKILKGSDAMAGEVGFMGIYDNFTKSDQYLDNMVAGRGLKRLAEALNGTSLSAKEIFEHNVKNVIEIFTHYVTDLLIKISYFYNPQAIVFTGSIAKASRKWLSKVIAEYNQKIFPELARVRNITVSKLRDSASIGAILTG